MRKYIILIAIFAIGLNASGFKGGQQQNQWQGGWGQQQQQQQQQNPWGQQQQPQQQPNPWGQQQQQQPQQQPNPWQGQQQQQPQQQPNPWGQQQQPQQQPNPWGQQQQPQQQPQPNPWGQQQQPQQQPQPNPWGQQQQPQQQPNPWGQQQQQQPQQQPNPWGQQQQPQQQPQPNPWGQQQQQQDNQHRQPKQPPPPPPAPRQPEEPIPPTVHTIRGCKFYGPFYMCSNVIVIGRRSIQQDVGCPTANAYLYSTCQDLLTTPQQPCCWCDEGGRRCLLRAPKKEAFRVPIDVQVIDEPHFRDWLGRSWDYQGVDDHVLVEVPGWRIDIKLSECSNSSRVTCITEAALVDTTTGKSVQFKANSPNPFGCGESKFEGEDKVVLGSLVVTKEEKGNSMAKWKAKLGVKLNVEILVEERILDVLVRIGKGFEEGDVKGGLLTGVRREDVAKYWGKNIDRMKLAGSAIRVGARNAFRNAVTWRLPPEESFICSTKTKPYHFAKVMEPTHSRVSSIVNKETRLKYHACCQVLACSPEGYDECIFDHVELNNYDEPKKCINGYNTIASDICARPNGEGGCVGGWTTWTICEDKKQSRRYIVEKVAIPGFGTCPFPHDYVEIRSC